MIFLDSSFIISSYCSVEENHETSREILRKIAEANDRLVLTDHVLSEVVTLVRRRYGSRRAFEVGNSIFNAMNTEVIQASREELEKALRIVLKYENFSFCDALTVTVMEREGIRKIVSFDSDFDAIKTIERMH